MFRRICSYYEISPLFIYFLTATFLGQNPQKSDDMNFVSGERQDPGPINAFSQAHQSVSGDKVSNLRPRFGKLGHISE